LLHRLQGWLARCSGLAVGVCQPGRATGRPALVAGAGGSPWLGGE
jgi:hypothetical protein